MGTPCTKSISVFFHWLFFTNLVNIISCLFINPLSVLFYNLKLSYLFNYGKFNLFYKYWLRKLPARLADNEEL